MSKSMTGSSAAVVDPGPDARQLGRDPARSTPIRKRNDDRTRQSQPSMSEGRSTIGVRLSRGSPREVEGERVRLLLPDCHRSHRLSPVDPADEFRGRAADDDHRTATAGPSPATIGVFQDQARR